MKKKDISVEYVSAKIDTSFSCVIFNDVKGSEGYGTYKNLSAKEADNLLGTNLVHHQKKIEDVKKTFRP